VWQAIIETSIDGKFGNNTKKATVAFQQKVFPNSPEEWDGIVGIKTWENGIESLKK
jgi:peptidoglycan hydrolase-like protein with peptidoglycan-binding domain